MFDKQLCKCIGKPEITIGDIFEYISTFVGISTVVFGVLFIFSFFTGILTLLIISPYIPIDYFPSGLEIASIGFGTIIWGINILLIMSAICSVKIATCPKKK